jgi:hypothetical protein
MRAVDPLVKVGAAFAASALLTYCIGDALLRWRDARLHDDAHLRKRVQARIAQLVSHPEAIEVRVEGGMVRVSGRVLAAEADGLLSQLTRVPRVYRVYNALDPVHDADAFDAKRADGAGDVDTAPA